MRLSPALLVVGVALTAATCRTLQHSRAPLHAQLRTDSAEFGIRFNGQYYLGKIGFVFVNTTPGPVSIEGCGGPPMPQVEKLVKGNWVGAYYPAYLMCRQFPDYSFASGATFRSDVFLMASPRGSNRIPDLQVDSINGVYRLRWVLREGTVADAPDARLVESISNQFRLTLH